MADDLAGYGSRPWVVRGGDRMRWCDMSVTHLRNAAKWFVEATEEEWNAMWAYTPRGEAAEDMWIGAEMAAFDRTIVAKIVARDLRDYADWRESRGLLKGKRDDGREFKSAPVEWDL